MMYLMFELDDMFLAAKPNCKESIVCAQAQFSVDATGRVRLGSEDCVGHDPGKDARPVANSTSKHCMKPDLKRKRADSRSTSSGNEHSQPIASDGKDATVPDHETCEFTEDVENAERFARMRGLVEDSSDEESDSADDPLTDIEDNAEPDLSSWGIGAFAANPEEEVVECSPSSRLAIVDLDWDNIQAIDILHIMRSFLPAAGSIKKVAIYVSDYGMERMAQEDAKGPGALGLFEKNKKREGKKHSMSMKSSKGWTEDISTDSMDDEASSSDGDRISGHESDASDEVNVEYLRIYEKSRLRYHYAVVECDSSESAAHLVSELDGKEFEMSHCIFDLRYRFCGSEHIDCVHI